MKIKENELLKNYCIENKNQIKKEIDKNIYTFFFIKGISTFEKNLIKIILIEDNIEFRNYDYSYIFKYNELISMQYCELLNRPCLKMLFQDKKTNKLIEILICEKENLEFNQIDLLILKLQNRGCNNIVYEKINLLQLIEDSYNSVSRIKEIYLNKCVELEGIISKIYDSKKIIEIISMDMETKKFSFIMEEDNKEKIKELSIGNNILINGIITKIDEERQFTLKCTTLNFSSQLDDLSESNDTILDKTNNNFTEEVKNKFSIIQKWFNSLSNIQKFILYIGLFISLFTKIYTYNILNSQEKKVTESYKTNNESINRENKIVNDSSNTNNNKNNSSENGTIDDIKKEIKYEIQTELENKGYTPNEEQLEKLTLYEMGRRMKENLENDPELGNEIEKAINDYDSEHNDSE